MYWYSGELILNDTLPIKISDPGLLYGATVFTTLRVYDRALDHPLTHWTLHCDRLHDSLNAFEWQLPDWIRLRQGAEILLTHYSVLRIAIFPDGREWIVGRALPQDLIECQQQGIIGWVAEEGRQKAEGNPSYPPYKEEGEDKLLLKRSLTTHKTGNYLSAWLALQKAGKFAAKEAILIDEQGNWLETSTGNLWGWKAGCWWTPALEENILPGIARSQLLEWLQAQNISVSQNQWTPDFVKNLEAIAYSNSVVEIVPFSNILTPEGQLSLNLTHQALKSYEAILVIRFVGK
ncbi:MAG: 4-amino-4-deoxychorismate lyase [Hydrococcus sp. RM1_1_31]|nr:4-amino-4-deoxychorismate lyase [Hydrococcus sp. RM1_1_31]